MIFFCLRFGAGREGRKRSRPPFPQCNDRRGPQKPVFSASVESLLRGAGGFQEFQGAVSFFFLRVLRSRTFLFSNFSELSGMFFCVFGNKTMEFPEFFREIKTMHLFSRTRAVFSETKGRLFSGASPGKGAWGRRRMRPAAGAADCHPDVLGHMARLASCAILCNTVQFSAAQYGRRCTARRLRSTVQYCAVLCSTVQCCAIRAPLHSAPPAQLAQLTRQFF